MTTDNASPQTDVGGHTAQRHQRRRQQQAGSVTTQEGVKGRFTCRQQDRLPRG
jgi:hypothetical protein